ncbi:MAG: sensor histidine kinase [Candidatus Xenobia bacterium]
MAELQERLDVCQTALEASTAEVLALKAVAARQQGRYDRAPVGFVMLNGLLAVTSLSETARRWLGGPRSMLRGKAFLRCLQPEDRPSIGAFLETCALNEAAKVTQVCIAKDGNARILEIHASAESNETQDGLEYSLVFLDISRQSRAEAEVQRLRRQGRQLSGGLHDVGVPAVAPARAGADDSGRRMIERARLEVREDEQRRIGRDLHDGAFQHLTAVDMMACALEEQLRPLSEHARTCAAIARSAREATAQIRLLVTDCYPADLLSGGLVGGLRILAAETEERSTLSCRVQVEGTPGATPSSVVILHLYRIAQEAVQNVVRHAAARTVSIILDRQPSRLRLIVRDDGVGLPPGRISGLGTRTMRERAALLGGSLSITSSPSGTDVTCVVPWPITL